MKWNFTHIFIIFNYLILPSVCSADHPGLFVENGAGGTIWTIPPQTLPQGKFALSTVFQLQKFQSLNGEKLTHRAALLKDNVDTLDYLLQSSLSVAIGITNDVLLNLNLPYISRTELRHGSPAHNPTKPPHTHEEGNANGLGDLLILPEWRFIHNQSVLFDAALLVGIYVPTGQTNIKNINGELFEPHHQPGTGAFSPAAGLSVSQTILKNNSLYANFLFTKMNKGAHNSKRGNVIDCNLSMAHLFETSHHHNDTGQPSDLQATGLLELHWSWHNRDSDYSILDSNTGGNILYLAPGLIVNSQNGLSAFISVGYPIYQKPNGVQTFASTQVIFGATILV
ncbi:transporter [Legionella sp. CNM-1927-20]|uniref:transporter n=1 Tax=Legionella sp. CNM-1927-20 TaxID=3422221 RepID=UPI00403B0366